MPILKASRDDTKEYVFARNSAKLNKRKKLKNKEGKRKDHDTKLNNKRHQ